MIIFTSITVGSGARETTAIRFYMHIVLVFAGSLQRTQQIWGGL